MDGFRVIVALGGSQLDALAVPFLDAVLLCECHGERVPNGRPHGGSHNFAQSYRHCVTLLVRNWDLVALANPVSGIFVVFTGDG